MNILVVCRNFFRGGGASSRWKSLVKYLSRKHRIYMITNLPRKLSESRVGNSNIRIFHCSLSPRFSNVPFLSPVNTISLIFSICIGLSKTKVDLMVGTMPEIEEGIACAVASKIIRIPSIMEVRDLIVEDHVEAVYSMLPKWFRRWVQFLLQRTFLWVVNSSDRVVTVTSTLKECLLSEGANVPIDVIPNGADAEIFYPARPNEKLKSKEKIGFEDDLLIIYAGAMGVVYYPMDVIFRAIKIVTQSFPNARLILCGSLGKHMEAQVENLGDNVEYFGQMDRESVADLMRTCDIGVITMDERRSTFCALTTKFFEYLSSGIPVVAACPKGGELDRLIREQQVGYSVCSGDHEAMAKSIVKLLQDRQKREFFAANGRDLITSEFTREKQAENYSEVLLTVERAERQE